MHDLRRKGEIWLEEPCRPHGPTRANQPHGEVVGVDGDVCLKAKGRLGIIITKGTNSSHRSDSKPRKVINPTIPGAGTCPVRR